MADESVPYASRVQANEVLRRKIAGEWHRVYSGEALESVSIAMDDAITLCRAKLFNPSDADVIAVTRLVMEAAEHVRDCDE